MRNFGTLYRFELKKLFQRKMLWAALVILTAVSTFLPAMDVMGTMYISGEATGREPLVCSDYDLIQCQRSDPAGLDGRPFDTDLIRETIRQMGVVDETDRVVSSGEDGQGNQVTVRRVMGSAPMDWSLEGYVTRLEYTSLWDALRLNVANEDLNESLTLETYQAGVDTIRDNYYDLMGLSQRDWWAAQREKLPSPLILNGYPSGGWARIEQQAYTVDILILLFATVALAGLFPMERQRRTDALARCARFGGTPLYWAKILAGLTVSFCGAAIMLGTLAGTSLLLLGPEDGPTAVQQHLNILYDEPMTVRRLALIACGLYLAAGVLYGAFVMAVSLITKGGTAAMGVCFGVLLASIMIPSLPPKWGPVSQIWSLLPSIIGVKGYTDPRLVRLGGYLTCYQAAPLLWLVLTLALAGLGLAIRRRTPDR